MEVHDVIELNSVDINLFSKHTTREGTPPYIVATSPHGDTVYISNISRFADDNGFRRRAIAECLVNGRDSYREWKYRYLDPVNKANTQAMIADHAISTFPIDGDGYMRLVPRRTHDNRFINWICQHSEITAVLSKEIV